MPTGESSPQPTSSPSAASAWVSPTSAGRCAWCGTSPPSATAKRRVSRADSLSREASSAAGAAPSPSDGSGYVVARRGGVEGRVDRAASWKTPNSSTASAPARSRSRCRSSAPAWTKRSGRPSDSNQRSPAQFASSSVSGRADGALQQLQRRRCGRGRRGRPLRGASRRTGAGDVGGGGDQEGALGGRRRAARRGRRRRTPGRRGRRPRRCPGRCSSSSSRSGRCSGRAVDGGEEVVQQVGRRCGGSR